ncbi:transcription factor GTE10-like isoform X1 [Vigna umbellata]|uniref:transcription factor GTE10-like isoform X1 n=1 Tax=Vigna umbellata TaxID=87088 RepID=UPI001F5E612B|nr:transcription factor GTE10-like isoform X1 [Vigna umbellata]XP_047157258.1 transcription factor GTE10-like isoform X1 [Vigna umbellata]XP_047157259.1 transcription factor GTE10-like isoform X1 [Vigna umbellata]
MAPTVPIEFAGQKESRKYSHSQNMGKSRKYSKAYATGFVPDFRHAVETMGESEGLGSLGRVDTELTASADSCAPKRKCPGLSTGGYGSFDVPFQLFSLSRMSGFERKDLKTRLTWELEQVKEFQKKVEAINSNALVLSPSSDIRSCSAGQKRPKLESQPLAMEVSVPHGKKRPLPGNSGPRTKKSISGRPELPKPAAPVASHAAMMKPCESLLNRLMTHQFGWVFNTPVDVVKLNIPDYFTVIKHPMDLGTVKRRITSGEYTNLMDFAADVRLTFSNAMTYNPPGNDVHVMADTLHKIFESRWKAIEKKIPVIDCVPSEPSRPTRMETEISDRVPPSKKKKITSNNVKPEPLKIIMTVEEKHKLSVELEAMLGELPDAIVDFLREQSYNAGQTNDDEIEIDIDALSDETLFKLRKLLDDYLLEKQRSQAKAGQCEMELLNESGFSNSPVQPCKGNEQVEEDVDIVGGNDPPISTYPPLEIDKDGTNRNSKCSSSSSSSSESGTSSSDSDSGSSSGSELDMAKTSEPLSGTKENVGSGSTLDQNKGDPGNSDTGKDSTNVGGQVEQTFQSKLVASEPESHQEGESAASKRQVSPEKLYRAALLRSRFADTILKAQEKALEKDEKRDPEKLRLEREELERRQKEEKARLQAEAKAAEEARRKAEAEAAAEAKRKRELEREAARQALQKMEKTVDINESSQFLEDLEMLSAVHDEPMPSFKEETSADLPQNGLGMINLQGNPLEQLGLYMKDDEEEEEEELPLSGAAGPSNDVEEGEID